MSREKDRALSLAEVSKITSLSRYTINRMEKQGLFPPRRALTKNAGSVGHLESEVLLWLRCRPPVLLSKDVEPDAWKRSLQLPPDETSDMASPQG